jgi:hypothetical protein
MRNTIALFLLTPLLLLSCGHSPKEEAVQAPVSKEALMEQATQPENLSEYGGTVFVPTMEHFLPTDSNSVYCATLLVAWEEVRKIIGTSLAIPQKYQDLRLLNASTSFRNVLKSNEYTASGVVSGDYIYTRAEFKKSLPFDYQLNKMEHRLTFTKQKVAAFGVMGDDNNDLTDMVKILYYKNDNNFIIKLKPSDKEHEIVLFKTTKTYPTMAAMAAAADSLIEIGQKERKIQSLRWKYQLWSDDEVVIPDIDFDISTTFKKLIGNTFRANSLDYEILQAWQRTSFKLNETGAEIASEAKVEICLSLDEEEEEVKKPTPKKMVFDKPFFLMLRRTDAQHPYFVLHAVNAELMVKE